MPTVSTGPFIEAASREPQHPPPQFPIWRSCHYRLGCTFAFLPQGCQGQREAVVWFDVSKSVTFWQDYPKSKSQRLRKTCFPSQQHASHVSSLSERNKGNFAVFPRVAQVSTMASARQFAPVTLSKVCKIGKGHLSRLSSLRGAPKTAQERPFQTREWKDCYLWDLTVENLSP